MSEQTSKQHAHMVGMQHPIYVLPSFPHCWIMILDLGQINPFLKKNNNNKK